MMRVTHTHTTKSHIHSFYDTQTYHVWHASSSTAHASHGTHHLLQAGRATCMYASVSM
jgi:hypothetical protein